MKKKILAVSFLLFIVWCGIAFSETCYLVEGTVNTMNVSNEMQMGKISLQLFDENDDTVPVFDETGVLVGRIIESIPQDDTYLQHTATFTHKDGSTSMFLTYRDEARTEPIVCENKDNSPCCFKVEEEISNIVDGRGFFEKVCRRADVKATGEMHICGDYKNTFELTGEICFE